MGRVDAEPLIAIEPNVGPLARELTVDDECPMRSSQGTQCKPLPSVGPTLMLGRRLPSGMRPTPIHTPIHTANSRAHVDVAAQTALRRAAHANSQASSQEGIKQ